MRSSLDCATLRFLKALKDEQRREQDPMKCRTAAEIASKVLKSQTEFDRVMTFIGPKQKNLITAWRREDGLVTQLNEAGVAWIDSQKEKWSPEARVALIALIFTIALSAVALLIQWLS